MQVYNSFISRDFSPFRNIASGEMFEENERHYVVATKDELQLGTIGRAEPRLRLPDVNTSRPIWRIGFVTYQPGGWQIYTPCY